MDLPKIVEAVTKQKESKLKVYPCHSNRASALGHNCVRYLVYMRTRWSEAIMPTVKKQFRFDMGNIMEAQALRDIQDAGVKLVEQQRMFEWKEYQITGKVDGMVGNERYPLEVKSVQSYDWVKINSAEDMINAPRPYFKKYVGQLMLYMLMANVEYGVFYLVNISTGEPKEIWVAIDYQFGEELVKKAEAVNAHVKAGTLPDRCAYDEKVCGWCEYSYLCLPDIKSAPGIEFIDNAEAEAMLKRREELKPLAVEFEKVDEKIKASFKGKEKAVVGDYLITSKVITKHYAAKPERDAEETRVKIVNLNKDQIKARVENAD